MLLLFDRIPRIENNEKQLLEGGAYAVQATDEWPEPLNTETDTLCAFTEAKCSSTPKILAILPQRQGPHSHVPGGYLVGILMEKIHGQGNSKPETRGLQIEAKFGS